MESLAFFLQGKAVLWKTDNYACSYIVKAGSSKENLQYYAEKILECCRNYRIDLKLEWVPREEIMFCDSLSKTPDTDDWETTTELLLTLNKKWGPFTVDRFADNNNKKVTRFNSKFYCPNTENVNAFSVSWMGENNFLVPPVNLIPKVLKHIRESKAEGTLVVPYWPSASFWPLISKDSNTFENFVEGYEVFNSGLKPGKYEKSFVTCKTFSGKILCLKIKMF